MTKVLEFPANRIAKGTHHFTPEMNQRKPNCQIEAKLGYGGNWRITTLLVLKGQGIRFYETNNESNCNNPKRFGIHIYYVTDRALNKLKQQYSISMESNLD